MKREHVALWSLKISNVTEFFMSKYGDHRGISGMAIIDNVFKESQFFRINICDLQKQLFYNIIYCSITEGQMMFQSHGDFDSRGRRDDQGGFRGYKSRGCKRERIRRW